MTDRVWNIGVSGTFDVENYGDLLFPLIAEAELTKRLGRVKVHAFSYHAKSRPEWPYPVTSVTELPQMAGSLDGVLIGGGFIIRFDKFVAAGYGPPTSAIHHPTGYWLTPALIALQQGIPLIWNTPGMHCNEIPKWAEPLMKLAFKLSSYIAVRDEPSRSALAWLADEGQIAVTPDTGFGISRLLDEHRPTAEFIHLREKSGFSGPYIVVQAIPNIEYLRFLRNNSQLFRDYRLLALPMGPVLGDDQTILNDLPGVVHLSEWPHPLLLAEIISQAAGVIGHSYHLMITALAFGVPIFSFAKLSVGKYTALSTFKTIYPLPNDREADPHLFISRLGKTAPSPEALAALDQLSDHWDRIASAIREGATNTQPTLNRFWQSLPGLLEHSDELSKLLTVAREDIELRDNRIAQLDDRVVQLNDHIAQLNDQTSQLNDRIAQLSDHIVQRDDHIAQQDDRIAQLLHSPSWKVTAPARFFMRTLKGLLGKQWRPMMALTQIGRHPMQTQPYAWAPIGSLFSPKDSKALAATFPCDHFKTVAGYGGEKDYEYEARELIPMAASTISNAEELSESWLALAQDFLSPAYRSAMSLLTGFDLATAALEVNVFHYGPRAYLGPHPDLPDKLVTHVLYFNQSWNREDGGCLTVLRSSDPNDVAAELLPLIGSSAVLVRSDNSWHAVSPVVQGCRLSRRSLTATFYRPGSVSTMWPPGDEAPLHRYDASKLEPETAHT